MWAEVAEICQVEIAHAIQICEEIRIDPYAKTYIEKKENAVDETNEINDKIESIKKRMKNQQGYFIMDGGVITVGFYTYYSGNKKIELDEVEAIEYLFSVVLGLAKEAA